MPQIRTSWKAIWYGASVDAATTHRQTDTLAAIAALSGYATVTTYVVKPEPDWDIVFNAQEDISGAVTSRATRKRTFNIELWPYLYNASSDPDIDDKDTLAALFDKPFLWLRIEATRTYPVASGEAHPIEILSWNNASVGGKHKLTLECRVRFPV